MFQVSVTLPVKQHNGTSNLKAIKDIQYQLAQQFGGYSSTRISGGWIDEVSGDLYEDESINVWTLVPSLEGVDYVMQFAPHWANELQQIELLVTVTPADATFVKGTRAQAASKQAAA